MTGLTNAAGGREAEHFLALVGQRVRALRQGRGLSRSVLSAASGVSERYIAQLEAGSGNISILLLRDIARCLGVTLGDLVGDDGDPADIAAVGELMRRADPARRRQALAAVAAIVKTGEGG